MNTKKFVATITLIAATGSAMAEVAYPPEVAFTSTKTRAEVIAELLQARKDGLPTFQRP
ncbi:DUF4148 domain-containing protein [Herminiimonas sp. CN]|uniref:DUF4148 domain-containing protein n=1 Tax=Herminiimonas sp. CN TaxID=1349818 RepID=UPI0009DF8715|nr:DUF4148 domain-containing protein [Herminiimonas sp. CN]